MSEILRLNTQSKTYTGDTTLAADHKRGYFFILQTSGTSTIEFGAGGGEIPLEEGFHYEPTVCPTGEIIIKTTGTCVVITG